MSASHGGVSAAQAVEEAIRVAQDAVKADEECDFAAAVALYSRSVELIKLGLQHQREGELVDNTILHRYCKLYSERIAMLGSYSEAQSPALAADPADRSAAVIAAPGGSGLLFTFDDSDIVQAAAPPPEPADEWRRPFWLMGMLRTSMARGGFLSADMRVYVPRRLWLQKGARFVALGAKLDCAECVVNELRRMSTIDVRSSREVGRAASALCDVLDSWQNSLARSLSYIPDAADKRHADGNAVSDLTRRMKGLVKGLDKTAARLGALPLKCADPHEYIQTLVDLFDAGAFVERWLEHYAPHALEHAQLYTHLHRVGRWFYEVLCAWVVHDLNALLARYARKTSAAFLKGTDP